MANMHLGLRGARDEQSSPFVAQRVNWGTRQSH